jgi:hypothetical protein
MKRLFLLSAVMSATLFAAPTQDEDLARYLETCREVAMEAHEASHLVRSPLTSQEFQKKFEVRFADDKYLSYYAECYAYTGGAHGMTEVTVGTLDRKSGLKVRLENIVTKDRLACLQKALREGAIKQVGGEENLLGEVTLTENFYIAADGLHFVYNPYAIACYAKGVIEVVIPFKTLGM